MEIDTAVRRYLLTSPTIVGYVGTKVFKHELLELPNGTGGRAIVVARSGGWSPPDRVQTSEYPTVKVEVWADVDRDGNGMKTVDNAIDKAFAVQRVVSRLMHRQRDVWWGAGGMNAGLRIITSMQADGPVAETVRDAHTKTLAEQAAIPFGDCAVVTVHFDLHVAP